MEHQSSAKQTSITSRVRAKSSAKQTSITSRVRATGIQFPINDGMTIPLYGKTFHVLTIAHITIVKWLDILYVVVK